MKILVFALLLFVFVRSAEAGPPLISEDPNTLGSGRAEVILAGVASGTSEGTAAQAPQLDFTIGLLRNLDFELVLGASHTDPEGGPRDTSGVVMAVFKWQPIMGPSLNASFTPSFGIDVLSAREFVITIPIQVEYTFERFAIGTDFGYGVVPNDTDQWHANLYARYAARPDLELLTEFWSMDTVMRPK